MKKTIETIENEDTEKQKIITDKEIEEHQSGKVLYEEILTGLLKEANTEFRKNEFNNFCFAIQGIWNNLFDDDRKFIEEEVKRIYKIDIDRQNEALRFEIFKKLMTTNIGEINKETIKHGLLSQWKYGNYWRRSYQIIQEVLRKKYQGKIKKFLKDKLEEKT